MMRLETRVGGRQFPSAEAGIKELNKQLAATRKELTAFGGPLAQISILLDRWVQKNFKSEGGNVGGWKPFKYGGRVMPDGKIDSSAVLEQDTGRLRASFLPFYTSRSAGIGSDLPYSVPQNKTRRLIPNRDDVIDQVKRIFQLHAKGIGGKK